MLLFELALRHLLGGRAAFFLRYRWRRWLSAAIALILAVALGVVIAWQGSPFTGALAGLAAAVILLVARRWLHAPLPESARGAYASAITFIAIAGIALAVMTLIVVISVMDGFAADIQEALLRTTAEVSVTGFGEEIDPRFTELVARVPGVRHADPFVENDLLLQLPGLERPLPIRLRGETVARLARPGGPRLVAGSWAALERPGEALIGGALADLYGLAPGAGLWLITTHGAVTPMGVLPQMMQVKIGGVFRSGFYEVDQNMIFTGVATAQELLGLGDRITGIAVQGDDPMAAPQLARRLEQSIAAPLFVQSWAETRKNLYEAMRTERIAMFIIETFLILIASFNITSTLFLAISRKTREIGLLLALGLSRRAVLALFALEGLFIGLAGTLLGAAGGVLFCLYLKVFPLHMPGGGSVYYIEHVPVHVSLPVILITIAASLFLSLAAAIHPARLAAQVMPAQALRYE